MPKYQPFIIIIPIRVIMIPNMLPVEIRLILKFFVVTKIMMKENKRLSATP